MANVAAAAAAVPSAEVDMDEPAILDELNGRISDMGLGLSPLSMGALLDWDASRALVHTLTAVAAEITRGFAALSYEVVTPPATWSAESLREYAGRLGCVHAQTQARADAEANAILLDYVLSEAQTARMNLAHAHTHSLAHTHTEASLTTELHKLCKLLSIPVKEGALQAHPDRALQQIKAKVSMLLGKLPVDLLTSTVPLLASASATPEVLSLLSEANTLLREDYTLRRSMLLSRLDVTVQSFLWSAKAAGREDEIMTSIAERRRALAREPAPIQPEDAFAAGPEVGALLSQRVTDASTKGMRYSSVKSVLIGAVPDRGGRVSEMKLSAHDLMPEWQARKETAGGGRGGARGGRGGRAVVASASAVGTGAEIKYSKEHDRRAMELLDAAAAIEGEARGDRDFADAMADDADDTAEVMDVDAAAASGRRGRTRGNGRWRGGRGRGRS